MKKKKVVEENYLDRIPVRNPALQWTTDAAGMVTLEIDNTGAINRVAQVLLKKPKISNINLNILMIKYIL